MRGVEGRPMPNSVQVYHSAEGRPFLISLKVVPQDAA